MRKSAAARDAYVRAEVVTALAHQVRAIRMQRGWSQSVLAKKLGTTQANVSRLEDPSYGRMTLQTLMDLAQVFDSGLQVRLVPFVSMLMDTYFPKPESKVVPSFEEEADHVQFYTEVPTAIRATLTHEARTLAFAARLVDKGTGNNVYLASSSSPTFIRG